MLLNQTSLILHPAIKFYNLEPNKISFALKTDFPIMFRNKNDNINYLSRRMSSEMSAVRGQYESWDQRVNRKGNGVGIEEFFQGKNIFITGATGLVGKALVEKLLRSTGVGKIYMLIKAADEEAAFQRLTKEIVKSNLFKCVEEEHGESDYKEIVRKKLRALAGNICQPNLGMDKKTAEAIMEEVDVIVQSAANTNLFERYDVILEANVTSPQTLMNFAKQCKKLKLFVHISTAYVCGKREGIILEEHLMIGEKGRMMDKFDDEFAFLYPEIDVAGEIKLANLESLAESSSGYDVNKELKRLGQQRAEIQGWHNAYQMTKAMGEMVLNEIRGDVPLLVIRPSVIESSYTQPFPGWIQGNRMYDPVIISYGKGCLPAFICDPDSYMDIIPIDMVANTTIAAIAKHGSSYDPNIKPKPKPEVKVYHAASSTVNPLRFSEFFGYVVEHFISHPLFGSSYIPCVKYFDNFCDLSKYTRHELLHKNNFNNKAQKLRKAEVAYVEQLCKMYEFLGFFNARFDTSNTQKLMAEMSIDEQLKFEIDVRNIDWKKYFIEIHIPGLRKHVINGK